MLVNEPVCVLQKEDHSHQSLTCLDSNYLSYSLGLAPGDLEIFPKTCHYPFSANY